MIPPLFSSGTHTWAPSGMDAFGTKLYVACLAGKQIRVFDLIDKSSYVWKDGFGRVRDVEIINSNLYMITNNRDGRGKLDKGG